MEQTVINNTGDPGAFRRGGGFLLDEGRDNGHFPDGEAAVGDGGVQGVDLGAHFLAEPVVEVVQHLFQNLTGGGILIEIVGVREKEALQAVFVAPGHIFQEPVVLQRAVGGVGAEILRGTDAVFLQQGENLAAGVALGDQQVFHDLTGGAGGHHVDQRVIVVPGVQVVNAGVDLLLGVGDVGIEVEQALVADQTGVVELVGDAVHGVGLVNGDGDGLVFPPESQHIGGADPNHPSQRDADDHDQCQPHDGDQNVGDAQQTLSTGFLRTSFFDGALTTGRFSFRGGGILCGVKITVAVPVFLFSDLVL